MVLDFDIDERTNPDTCLHMLAYEIQFNPYRPELLCVSCDSLLDRGYVNEFAWDWDNETGIWQRRSIKESRKALRGIARYFETSDRFHGDDILGYQIGGKLYDPRDVIVYLRDRGVERP